MDKTILHPSILALVSLAASVAANHPNLGLCQVDKLRQYGVTKEQIDLVIEIARHIKEEAAMKVDNALDAAYDACWNEASETSSAEAGSCCTPTASGQSCC